MIVVLWIPNSLTSLANCSFSLNLLKICPWRNATFIVPFFFVLIISSYRLNISAAFSGSCISSASLFKSSNSRFFLLWYSNAIIVFLFLLLMNVSPFYYLPCLSTSINKKNNHCSAKSKTKKYLSKLFFFFASLEAKKLPRLPSSFLFHILLLKYYR